jgi:transcriptional regulator with XRE-family HTH domain
MRMSAGRRNKASPYYFGGEISALCRQIWCQQGGEMPDLQDELVDKIIGKNIRRERTETRVTQAALAQAIGVTFQQVQKYERADNRVSASRLFRIGQALSVPVPTFYHGLEAVAAMPPDRTDALANMLSKPEMLRVIHACCEISDFP